MTLQRLNINANVLVRITDAGIKRMRQNHDKWNDLANGRLGVFKPPGRNHLGYSKMQLWHLMYEFGQYCILGGENMFDKALILIDSADLTIDPADEELDPLFAALQQMKK